MTSVWPYQPEDGAIIESLEWLTDVQRTYGLEYRRSLRPIPRQEWQHTYYLDELTLLRAIQAARNLGDEDFYLPIWQERTKVGSISASTTVLPVDPDYKCYNEAGYLIIWDDEDNYETAAILTLGASTITLESGVVANYTDAWVMPVRLARFAQPFSLQPMSSAIDIGHADARFLAVTTEDLFEEAEPGIGYTKHLGYPIFLNQVQASGDVRQTYQHRTDGLDSGAGGVSQLPVVEQPEETWAVSWATYSEEETYNTKIWLHKRKGQWKCFWLPSWTDDLELADDIDIGDPTITVVDIDFDQWAAVPYDAAVWDAGIVRGMRIVSSSAGGGGTQELTLSAVSTIEVDMVDVTRFHQLRLVRFATDRIEIRHGILGQASVFVHVVEVPDVPTAAGSGYDEHDQSEEESSPVFLFHFVQGTVNYRYSSLGETFVASGQSWNPGVIVPGTFRVAGDVPRDNLSIQLARDNGLAETFLGYPPDSVTTLTVYRCDFYDTSSPIVYWSGRVTKATASGNEVTLDCDSWFSAMKRKGPRAVCSRTCRYVLYGRGCNLDEDDWDEAATVTGVSGTTITLSATVATSMEGGVIKDSNGVRVMIYSHTAGTDTLEIKYKSKALRDQMVANPGGFAVTLYQGCDHTLSTCTAKGNKGNFGGYFGIPAVNPTNKLTGIG